MLTVRSLVLGFSKVEKGFVRPHGFLAPVASQLTLQVSRWHPMSITMLCSVHMAETDISYFSQVVKSDGPNCATGFCTTTAPDAKEPRQEPLMSSAAM